MPSRDVTDSRPIRLLCVEDNPDDVELMGIALERADPHHRYELKRVDNAASFVAALNGEWDVILCDFNLPRFSPYAALQILVTRRSSLPLIVLTRAIGEEAAVHVLRCGAKDYLTKDKLGTLPQIIGRVLEERRRQREKERLDAELQGAYARLKELSARFVLAQERERSMISRELHDQLGQTLTAVVIHLHAAERAPEPEAARKHGATAAELASGALQQLKTLSFSLRPAQLDLLGLVPAVQSAMQRIAEPAGLEIELTTRGKEPQTLEENAAVVVRLVQEALTNTVRHAKATQVRVRLRFLPQGRICLLIVDDGRGFDKGAVLNGQQSERNIGLYGMIERTELAGGTLHIRTREGRGVAIRAVL
jgi:signal transduction histidine kinase